MTAADQRRGEDGEHEQEDVPPRAAGRRLVSGRRPRDVDRLVHRRASGGRRIGVQDLWRVWPRSAHAGRLPDILEVFTRLEPDGAAGRDADFLAGPGVAADAAFPRFHLEHTESPELDT